MRKLLALLILITAGVAFGQAQPGFFTTADFDTRTPGTRGNLIGGDASGLYFDDGFVSKTYFKDLISASSVASGYQPLDADLTTLAGGIFNGNTYLLNNSSYYAPGAGDNNSITGNAYSLRVGQGISVTNSGTSAFLGSNITATGNGVNASNRNVAVGNTISMLPRTSTGEMTHNVMIGAEISNAADFGINIGYDNEVLEHAATAIGTHAFNWGFASGIYGGQWIWNRSGGTYAGILGGLYISNNGSNSAILSSAYVNNGANNNLVFAPNGVTTATLSTANTVYLFPHGSGNLLLNGTAPTSGYEVDLQGADLRVDGNILQTGLTASRALVTDASKVISSSAVTATELGYVSGVTSAIQTQIDGKQATDSDLTAVAGLSSTGIVARTGTGTASVRTITGDTEIAVSNGNGVSGNPTLSIGSGIARVVYSAVMPIDDVSFWCRMRGNDAAGLPNVISAATPTVNGTPAAASVVADSNSRPSIGKCLTLDGTDDSLNYGDICDIGTGNLTTGGWVKTTTTGGLGVIAKLQITGGNPGFVVQLGGTGTSYQVYTYYGGLTGTAAANTIVATTNFRDGNWHHLAVVFDRTGAGTVTVYLDGVSQGSGSIATATGSSDNSANLLVGVEWDGSGFWFNGQLDEVFMVNRTMTAAEILRLYTVGTFSND